MSSHVAQYFEIIADGIIFHAASPTQRLNGTQMSDVEFSIPVRNITTQAISIAASKLHIALKDESGRIFMVGTADYLKDGSGSKQNVDAGRQKIIRFNIVVDLIVYNKIDSTRQMLISINNLPPAYLACNAVQGNWISLSPEQSFGGLLDTKSSGSQDQLENHRNEQRELSNKINTDPIQKSNFRFVCPYCGQHFDCPPECEGVACECPTCNNTIYPERPPEIKEMNSTLTISCAFLDSIPPNSSAHSCSEDMQDTTNTFDNMNQDVEAVPGEYEEEDESEDIDWDEIDDAMQSDMDDVLDSIVDDTTYDMPSEATDEFDQAAEDAWSDYQSSSSYQSDFETWCEENGYSEDDDDDMDSAEDEMKDEWIDNWKSDNEDDWNQTWCEEHVDELKEKWHQEKENEWKKEWAQDNADYHNVTAEQILKHWGMEADIENVQETFSKDSCGSEINRNFNDKGGTNMKNKIAIETQFKTITGPINATCQGNTIIFYGDFSYPNQHQKIAVIVYDEDGDICGREETYIFVFRSPHKMVIEAGSIPVRIVIREQ